MDALTQALEAYVSRNATPLTDALSIEAFALLWKNLPRAWENGRDIDARSACAIGSLMAGMALSNARLGAVHGMAHPLGVRYALPHGLVCAVLLPEVVRINLPHAAAKYARAAEVTGGDLVDSIEDMNTRLGVYDGFDASVLDPADFDAIAEESMPSGSLKANPKTFETEDIVSVLEAIHDR